jgi:hypothetical protein
MQDRRALRTAFHFDADPDPTFHINADPIRLITLIRIRILLLIVSECESATTGL